MSVPSGITTKTVTHRVFDAGLLIRNYDPAQTATAQQSNWMGALSGGCAFNVKEDIYTPKIDGAIAPVKQTERIVGREAKLSANHIEIGRDVITDMLPGASFTDEGAYHKIIPGAIGAADYLTNIAVLVTHSSDPTLPEGAVCILYNARGTGELKMDFKFGEDATLPSEFVACQDPATMSETIWSILLPEVSGDVS